MYVKAHSSVLVTSTHCLPHNIHVIVCIKRNQECYHVLLTKTCTHALIDLYIIIVRMYTTFSDHTLEGDSQTPGLQRKKLVRKDKRKRVVSKSLENIYKVSTIQYVLWMEKRKDGERAGRL